MLMLRDHPLISHNGQRSWPPYWFLVSGTETQRPRVEIGRLEAVRPSVNTPANRCFLTMSHERATYIGCLLIDNIDCCDKIVKLLQNNLNRPIAEIGSLET
jgi:hypothetical protein